MTNRIAKEWESYRREVMPRNPSPVQVQETRRAFYAGAQALVHVLVRQLDPDAEPTEADLRMMDEIDEELQAFVRAVAAGRS